MKLFVVVCKHISSVLLNAHNALQRLDEVPKGTENPTQFRELGCSVKIRTCTNITMHTLCIQLDKKNNIIIYRV